MSYYCDFDGAHINYGDCVECGERIVGDYDKYYDPIPHDRTCGECGESLCNSCGTQREHCLDAHKYTYQNIQMGMSCSECSTSCDQCAKAYKDDPKIQCCSNTFVCHKGCLEDHHRNRCNRKGRVERKIAHLEESIETNGIERNSCGCHGWENEVYNSTIVKPLEENLKQLKQLKEQLEKERDDNSEKWTEESRKKQEERHKALVEEMRVERQLDKERDDNLGKWSEESRKEWEERKKAFMENTRVRRLPVYGTPLVSTTNTNTNTVLTNRDGITTTTTNGKNKTAPSQSTKKRHKKSGRTPTRSSSRTKAPPPKTPITRTGVDFRPPSHVRKFFPGSGWFTGTVTTTRTIDGGRSSMFRIHYDDNNEHNDCTEQQLLLLMEKESIPVGAIDYEFIREYEGVFYSGKVVAINIHTRVCYLSDTLYHEYTLDQLKSWHTLQNKNATCTTSTVDVNVHVHESNEEDETVDIEEAVNIIADSIDSTKKRRKKKSTEKENVLPSSKKTAPKKKKASKKIAPKKKKPATKTAPLKQKKAVTKTVPKKKKPTKKSTAEDACFQPPAHIRKFFPGHGWFTGQVTTTTVADDEDRYVIHFDDDDEHEECSQQELRQLMEKAAIRIGAMDYEFVREYEGVFYTGKVVTVNMYNRVCYLSDELYHEYTLDQLQAWDKVQNNNNTPTCFITSNVNVNATETDDSFDKSPATSSSRTENLPKKKKSRVSSANDDELLFEPPTRVRKFFSGYGWFTGRVTTTVSTKTTAPVQMDRTYTIQYEDNDYEECSQQQLQHLIQMSSINVGDIDYQFVREYDGVFYSGKVKSIFGDDGIRECYLSDRLYHNYTLDQLQQWRELQNIDASKVKKW